MKKENKNTLKKVLISSLFSSAIVAGGAVVYSLVKDSTTPIVNIQAEENSTESSGSTDSTSDIVKTFKFKMYYSEGMAQNNSRAPIELTINSLNNMGESNTQTGFYNTEFYSVQNKYLNNGEETGIFPHIDLVQKYESYYSNGTYAYKTCYYYLSGFSLNGDEIIDLPVIINVNKSTNRVNLTYELNYKKASQRLLDYIENNDTITLKAVYNKLSYKNNFKIVPYNDDQSYVNRYQAVLDHFGGSDFSIFTSYDEGKKVLDFNEIVNQRLLDLNEFDVCERVYNSNHNEYYYTEKMTFKSNISNSPSSIEVLYDENTSLCSLAFNIPATEICIKPKRINYVVDYATGINELNLKSQSVTYEGYYKGQFYLYGKEFRAGSDFKRSNFSSFFDYQAWEILAFILDDKYKINDSYSSTLADFAYVSSFDFKYNGKTITIGYDDFYSEEIKSLDFNSFLEYYGLSYVPGAEVTLVPHFTLSSVDNITVLYSSNYTFSEYFKEHFNLVYSDNIKYLDDFTFGIDSLDTNIKSVNISFIDADRSYNYTLDKDNLTVTLNNIYKAFYKGSAYHNSTSNRIADISKDLSFKIQINSYEDVNHTFVINDKFEDYSIKLNSDYSLWNRTSGTWNESNNYVLGPCSLTGYEFNGYKVNDSEELYQVVNFNDYDTDLVITPFFTPILNKINFSIDERITDYVSVSNMPETMIYGKKYYVTLDVTNSVLFNSDFYKYVLGGSNHSSDFNIQKVPENQIDTLGGNYCISLNRVLPSDYTIDYTFPTNYATRFRIATYLNGYIRDTEISIFSNTDDVIVDIINHANYLCETYEKGYSIVGYKNQADGVISDTPVLPDFNSLKADSYYCCIFEVEYTANNYTVNIVKGDHIKSISTNSISGDCDSTHSFTVEFDDGYGSYVEFSSKLVSVNRIDSNTYEITIPYEDDELTIFCNQPDNYYLYSINNDYYNINYGQYSVSVGDHITLYADPRNGVIINSIEIYREDTNEKINLGYYSDSDSYFFIMPGSNINVNVDYSFIDYNIEFDLQGGSFPEGTSIPSTYNYDNSNNWYFDVVPTKDGYSFIGWSSDSNSSYPSIEPIKGGKETIGKEPEPIGLKPIGKEPIGKGGSGSFYNYPLELSNQYFRYLYRYSDVKITAMWEANESKIKIYVMDNNIEGMVDDLIGVTDAIIEGLPTEEYMNSLGNGKKFDGWYLDNQYTNKFEATTYPSGTTKIYAKWLKYEYTIRFIGVNNSVISEQKVKAGEMPVIPQDIPTKDADLTSRYYFNGWDADVLRADNDVDYVATFRSECIDYTVTFLVEDKVYSQKTNCHYGEAIDLPAEPTKASDDQFDYKFVRWTPVPTTCQGTLGPNEFTAVFEPITRKYRITFVDDLGHTLFAQDFEYGTLPEFMGNTTKESTNRYTYVFKGWNKDLGIVTCEETYTAVYEALEKEFIIVFYDENGNELSKEVLHYGEKVKLPENSFFSIEEGYELNKVEWKTIDGEELSTDNLFKSAKLEVYANVVTSPISYELSYDLDNGEAINPTVYTIETETFTLNNPVKEGYNFIGWTIDGNEELTLDATIEKGSQGNHSYKANYEVIEEPNSNEENSEVISEDLIYDNELIVIEETDSLEAQDDELKTNNDVSYFKVYSKSSDGKVEFEEGLDISKNLNSSKYKGVKVYSVLEDGSLQEIESTLDENNKLSFKIYETGNILIASERNEAQKNLYPVLAGLGSIVLIEIMLVISLTKKVGKLSKKGE